MIKLLYKGDLMLIEEKYKIVYENNKRYYVFDMLITLPVLDNVVPYFFKYRDIEIYEASWNRMTIKILEEIDKLNPKSEEELLGISYFWSKQDVFTRNKKTNHSTFKNLFLNTNHSSTHAMMSIQCLLKAYSINLSECYFLVRKHPVAEPIEVREYYRNETIAKFKKCLELNGFKQERINNIIKNFDYINKFLNKVSSGYIDFFLFDDYYCFSNYKSKTLEVIQRKFKTDDKTYIVIKRCLGYLDDFYKNSDYYVWLSNNSVDPSLVELFEKEINFLFNSLKTNILVANKLFGRMILIHKNEMVSLGKMNNSVGLYKICSILLKTKFYFKEPYISKEPIMDLTNDQIIYSYAYSLEEFTINDLSNYAEKMHLKKLDNYLAFINDSADDYVQVDRDRLISKNILKINDDLLRLIKKELLFYINSFGKIDSEKYCGFSALPKINFEWNKYLLIGIIRSYFMDSFEIEYTINNYKKLAYIIDIQRKL